MLVVVVSLTHSSPAPVIACRSDSDVKWVRCRGRSRWYQWPENSRAWRQPKLGTLISTLPLGVSEPRMRRRSPAGSFVCSSEWRKMIASNVSGSAPPSSASRSGRRSRVRRPAHMPRAKARSHSCASRAHQHHVEVSPAAADVEPSSRAPWRAALPLAPRATRRAPGGLGSRARSGVRQDHRRAVVRPQPPGKGRASSSSVSTGRVEPGPQRAQRHLEAPGVPSRRSALDRGLAHVPAQTGIWFFAGDNPARTAGPLRPAGAIVIHSRP